MMNGIIDNIDRDEAVKLICSHIKYRPEKEIAGRCMRQDALRRCQIPLLRTGSEMQPVGRHRIFV